MNDRISPKRLAAEFAFAEITSQHAYRTRVQLEEDISTAERHTKTARLRAERLARERFDVKN